LLTIFARSSADINTFYLRDAMLAEYLLTKDGRLSVRHTPVLCLNVLNLS